MIGMYSELHYLYGGFVFLLGALVGSFANVCIVRMPWEQSLIWPGSRCPPCGHVIRWWENLPVLSWLILRGRCSSCKRPIPIRYPAVELLMALLFLYTFWLDALRADPRGYGHFPDSFWPQLMYHLSLTALCVIVTFIDGEHQIIPASLTDFGLVCGLLTPLIWPDVRWAPVRGSTVWESGVNGLWGAAAGVLVVMSVRLMGAVLFRKEAMGLGDVSLMAVIGAYLGGIATVVTLFLASFLGLGHAFLKILVKAGKFFRGRPVHAADSEMAFGPYLSLAALILMWTWPWLWPDWIHPRVEAFQYLWELTSSSFFTRTK